MPGSACVSLKQTRSWKLDSQALAAFGAACIDHGAATTGLHADQKPWVRARRILEGWYVRFIWNFPNRLSFDPAPKP